MNKLPCDGNGDVRACQRVLRKAWSVRHVVPRCVGGSSGNRSSGGLAALKFDSHNTSRLANGNRYECWNASQLYLTGDCEIRVRWGFGAFSESIADLRRTKQQRNLNCSVRAFCASACSDTKRSQRSTLLGERSAALSVSAPTPGSDA